MSEKIWDLSFSNSSYEKFNIDDKWLHQVDELKFPFNPEWKNIGVNVSGGADSALGTSILATIIRENGYDCKIHFLTNVRVWNNRPWAGPISVEVYEKIKSMFPDVIGDRLQNFIPPEIEEGSLKSESNPKGVLSEIGVSGDRICTQSFNMYAINTKKLNAVYNFITRNPKDLKHRSAPWDRRWESLDDFDRCPQISGNENSYHIQPFKLVEKDWIIGQYYRRNWLELLNTTRSCEGDIHLFPDGRFEDYTTYVHGTSDCPTCLDAMRPDEDIGRCCYWCVERQWATETAKQKLGIG